MQVPPVVVELLRHSTRALWIRALLGGVVLNLALPTLGAAGTHANTRQGWFIGLGVGGGSAALTGDGESTNREGGAAASLRGGYAFNPNVGLGLESNLWFKSENNVDFTLSTYTAAISFFPAEGLVLRAGIGGGQAEAQVSSGPSSVTATENGLGVTAGIAYELRVARRFALGPQVDYAYVDVDSFNANYVNFGIAFNWYFIPE